MSQVAYPITILIGALGGEGGGVLAQWLVETAMAAGYPAQATSIPGVAQRTGATTYYVEIFPQMRMELGGREPVLSLVPVPGGIDLVVASELLEAARIVGSGMVSPDRTVVVTSTSRALTTIEKMALGDGRFDPEVLLAVARKHSARLATFDMEAAAREAGTIVSAVMFGAVAGSGVLPFGREDCEAAIRADARGAEASLRGFARGFDAVRAVGLPPALPASEAPIVDSTLADFPAQVRDFVALGNARMLEFQDKEYADMYRARIERVLDAERRIDPSGAHGFALTRETARFLALWMAFDDVVRVAGLKCRASRFARVRQEVAAREGDVVRIVDFMKPGVPELAGLFPPSWSARFVGWDRKRQARGKPPLAFALHLKIDTIVGFLAVRILAALKGMRRRGARYAQEQTAIERWLAAIDHAATTDWACAHELALCGRLIKGYGATNERAKHNLAHIVDHLGNRGAAAIREAREAALADEGGKALDQALVAHGVPARPVVAQPIRWTRKRPAESASVKVG
jgi:indolepyruvate ferredoxin oxidoreductase beta subunit